MNQPHIAIYDANQWEGPEAAQESGALYVMGSNWTYDDETGLQDLGEAIAAAGACVGNPHLTCVIARPQGWRSIPYVVDALTPHKAAPVATSDDWAAEIFLSVNYERVLANVCDEIGENLTSRILTTGRAIGVEIADQVRIARDKGIQYHGADVAASIADSINAGVLYFPRLRDIAAPLDPFAWDYVNVDAMTGLQLVKLVCSDVEIYAAYIDGPEGSESLFDNVESLLRHVAAGGSIGYKSTESAVAAKRAGDSSNAA
jgi:hypothetical protein